METTKNNPVLSGNTAKRIAMLIETHSIISW